MIDIRSYFKHKLLPQHCLLCGSAATDLALCAHCRQDLPWHVAPACPVCALPNPGGERCGACLKEAPAFDRTYAMLDFQYPVDALLRRYKYSGLLSISHLMASLLAEQLHGAQRPDLLIAMPLHPSRLKARGFNQALEIARVVGKSLNIPLNPQACSRIRPTPPQAGLPWAERRKNLRGAFECTLDLSGITRRFAGRCDDNRREPERVDPLCPAGRCLASGVLGGRAHPERLDAP